ncbi:STAS domain-containing protein [Actinomycetospora cinnamomea]|uniref:Anti-sigma factor antagonist n=1 Tax=Actinomycetospora cinnamomea TaxID=663609 RepID=A0A2U1F0Z7_9PSEU|nr:STAS domain-containing protein [Actinomycetospora cinnamomea]PVZ05864.1 anti-sigma B factor antagonist [Actinomycetospora cinnamomea]
MADLTISTEHAGDEVVVAVGGDLDYDSHTRLEAAIDAALHSAVGGSPGGLVLDLAAVTYCDSCGLRVLLGAHRRATEVGATFALRGAHGQPARALRLTGLDQVFG